LVGQEDVIALDGLAVELAVVFRGFPAASTGE
jgi:hypothetical protein